MRTAPAAPHGGAAPIGATRIDTPPRSAERRRLAFGLIVLKAAVTGGVLLFLTALVLQKSVFDVHAATHAEEIVRPKAASLTPAESGSLAPPIGPFLGFLFSAGVAAAVFWCDIGRGRKANRAFVTTLGLAAAVFLAMTVYRMRNPHPDSGVIEVGLCGLVWFAGVIVATGYLERVSREIDGGTSGRIVRSRIDLGMVIVLVSLVSLAVTVGIQAIAASRGQSLSFAETPILTLFNTLAGELLLGAALCSLVWLLAFRRLARQMILVASPPEPETPDRATTFTRPRTSGSASRS